MKTNTTFAHLNPVEVLLSINTSLKYIDNRLISHGERVAFIAQEINKEGNLMLDEKKLFLLCLFHDIGAYKTDEIDRMVLFETKSVAKHSIYGYLFLKHFSPLSDVSEAILYHHSSWAEQQNLGNNLATYSALIQLADRVDILFSTRKSVHVLEELYANTMEQFSPEQLVYLKLCCKNKALFSRFMKEEWKSGIQEFVSSFYFAEDEAIKYLEMLVYSIDFCSECTVTHTINTISISKNIAKHFHLSDHEQKAISLGALLHDVGKVAIPIEILESEGKLSNEEMFIMRTHVVKTEKIIRNIVCEEVCEIALRHHEKLDGSGYPYGLTAVDLTFPQRILAVADILSALCGSRSYKEPFPKEKALRIITKMRHTLLDPDICDYVLESFDDILESTRADNEKIIDLYQTLKKDFVKISQTPPFNC